MSCKLYNPLFGVKGRKIMNTLSFETEIRLFKTTHVGILIYNMRTILKFFYSMCTTQNLFSLLPIKM